jgi:nicotinate-nucleotide pyrophosphorylase (carboxylating)
MPSPVSVPPLPTWRPLVELAIAEDVGAGDVTSALTIAEDARGRARIESREPVVVCGLEVAEEVFRQIDPNLALQRQVREGDSVSSDTALLHISGSVRAILTAERTALNFMARMCGVAMHARRFVEEVAGTGAAIVDTRKTLPGWRVLDKYAAAAGGATNHRVGLFDGILLKDNHIAAAGGVTPAVKSALAGAPAGLRVQVEIQSAAEADEAVAAGADFLLLDNCDPGTCREIAERCGAGVLLESSGGIGLHNVREHAEAGVHRISIGAITHSAPSADLALEMIAAGE